MGILPNGEYTDIPEEWFPLIDFFIPGINPWYMVSNYGKIYNKHTNNIIPQNYRETEYTTIRLSFRDGSSRNFELHRVIALIYCWNGPDFDYTKDVNHRDGIKGHNWAWNLEWCTHKENLDHCIDTGLMPLGEERNNSIYTDDQVEMVCQLIADGKSGPEIRDIMQLQNCDILSLVQNLKNGHCWKHISCKYDFSNAKTKNVFSDNELHQICKYFEDNGIDVTYKKVLDHIGFDYSQMSYTQLQTLSSYISSLRVKRSFKNICNQYNY